MSDITDSFKPNSEDLMTVIRDNHNSKASRDDGGMATHPYLIDE